MIMPAPRKCHCGGKIRPNGICLSCGDAMCIHRMPRKLCSTCNAPSRQTKTEPTKKDEKSTDAGKETTRRTPTGGYVAIYPNFGIIDNLNVRTHGCVYPKTLDEAVNILFGLLRHSSPWPNFKVGFDYDSKKPGMFFGGTTVGLVGRGGEPLPRMTEILIGLTARGVVVAAIHTDSSNRRYSWKYFVPKVVPFLRAVRPGPLVNLRATRISLRKGDDDIAQLVDAMLLAELDSEAKVSRQFAHRHISDHVPAIFNLSCAAVLNDILYCSDQKIKGEQNVYEKDETVDAQAKARHMDFLIRTGLLSLHEATNISIRRLLVLGWHVTPDMRWGDIRSYIFAPINLALKEFLLPSRTKPWETEPSIVETLSAMYYAISELAAVYVSPFPAATNAAILRKSEKLNMQRAGEWHRAVHVRFIQDDLEIDLTTPPDQTKVEPM